MPPVFGDLLPLPQQCCTFAIDWHKPVNGGARSAIAPQWFCDKGGAGDGCRGPVIPRVYLEGIFCIPPAGMPRRRPTWPFLGPLA
jgi:hypothetical protein